MRVTTIILGILILQISCSNNRTENKIDQYLKENYEVDWDKTEYVSLEDKPVFYDKGNPPQLEKLNLKILEQKTGYEFNKTILSTGILNYLELEMIIAIPKSDDKDIRELKSPIFTGVSENFISIFNGLEIASQEDKEELVKQISNLFKEITYEGVIKNIEKKNEDYVSELWHGRLKWRILNFDFEDNKLVKLEIRNPKSSFTKIENE